MCRTKNGCKFVLDFVSVAFLQYKAIKSDRKILNFYDNIYILIMTKAEIVNEISRKTGIEKTTILKTVEAFMESIRTSLSEGTNIYLRGFGSFIVKERAEKTARNISKNTTIIIPAHYIPAFKPSKSFVEKVKNNVKK